MIVGLCLKIVDVPRSHGKLFGKIIYNSPADFWVPYFKTNPFIDSVPTCFQIFRSIVSIVIFRCHVFLQEGRSEHWER